MMSHMSSHLRRHRRDEVAWLHALNQAEVPAVGGLDADAFAALLDLATHTVVAQIGDAVGGYAVLFGPATGYGSPNYRWFSDRSDDFLYVDRVVVAPTHRRQGLGRLLYDEAVRLAATRPLLAEVNTLPRNDGSLAFHAVLGFVEVGRLASPQGDKEVAMLCRQPG